MKKLFGIVWKIIKVALFAIGGLTVVGILALIALVFVVALSSPGMHKIEDKSVLIFNLDTSITDRPTDEFAETMSRVFGGGESGIQLRGGTPPAPGAATAKR